MPLTLLEHERKCSCLHSFHFAFHNVSRRV